MVKYEHEIGITKGTPVEKFVAGNFEGETNEVGIYLAMSRQASREGYGELAEVFKRLAWEEAEHAARFCEMNGIIKDTLKENIEWMMGGENGRTWPIPSGPERSPWLIPLPPVPPIPS